MAKCAPAVGAGKTRDAGETLVAHSHSAFAGRHSLNRGSRPTQRLRPAAQETFKELGRRRIAGKNRIHCRKLGWRAVRWGRRQRTHTDRHALRGGARRASSRSRTPGRRGLNHRKGLHGYWPVCAQRTALSFLHGSMCLGMSHPDRLFGEKKWGTMVTLPDQVSRYQCPCLFLVREVGHEQVTVPAGRGIRNMRSLPRFSLFDFMLAGLMVLAKHAGLLTVLDGVLLVIMLALRRAGLGGSGLPLEGQRRRGPGLRRRGNPPIPPPPA
jgi:hypothetical protein